MTRKELQKLIEDKYGDGKGIVRGYPATFLYLLCYGYSKEEWDAELTPEYIQSLVDRTGVEVPAVCGQ